MHPRFFSDQKKAVELPIESLSNESTLHRADQFGRTGCYRATTVVCLIAARLVQTSCATQAWPSRTNNFSLPRSQVRNIGGLFSELNSIVGTFRRLCSHIFGRNEKITNQEVVITSVSPLLLHTAYTCYCRSAP